MSAIDDVAAERRRQIDVEGWTAAHDAQWTRDELVRAAVCYAHAHGPRSSPRTFWPWAAAWWKSAERRRNLVKAAALLIAEIDRLDAVEAGE